MAQQVRTRKQRVISYSANNRVDEELSRGMVYRELMLRLEGQLTLADSDNTAANTERGDEWACINRIDIIANNTDVLMSIRGPDLWWYNYFMYKTNPPLTPAIGDNSVANPAFDSTLIIPFWMPNSLRPIDTALDARQLSDLKVEVTWASHTSINANATGFTVAPTLTCHSLESFNIGNVAFSKYRMFPIEKEITATNSQFLIDIPVNYMYRGFMMIFTDAAVEQGDILNNFKLISGTTVFADLPSEVINQWYRMRNNVHRGFSGTAYDDLRVSDDHSIDGVYFYDHVTDGFLSESIDTLGFSEFQLELDVTIGSGTTKALIYPMQITPVRGQQRNG